MKYFERYLDTLQQSCTTPKTILNFDASINRTTTSKFIFTDIDVAILLLSYFRVGFALKMTFSLETRVVGTLSCNLPFRWICVWGVVNSSEEPQPRKRRGEL